MFCDQCGDKGGPADAFCTTCGAALSATQPAVTPEPVQAPQDDIPTPPMVSDDDELERLEMWRRVLESVGEGRLADKDTLSPQEARRLQQKLARNAVELEQALSFHYSTRDLVRLKELSTDDYRRIGHEWRSSPASTALNPFQLCLWIAGGLLAWLLLKDQSAVRSLAGDLLTDVPAALLYVVGGAVALGVVVMYPMALEGLTASQRWDSYSEGYSDGLCEGVNRALHISPERERQIEDEWQEAEVAGLE